MNYYYHAIYAYEDLEIHKGTAEEINHYIERKLSEHSFSWYFAKKFTDFAGLHMAFFATVLLSFLFIQDTRKSTYELLHTKPVTAIQYICGKVISGFISMLGVLVILNVIFFMLCLKTSLKSSFPVTPIDFCVNSLIYIVPNLLMICCVYTITAVIFKNPLPAAPILFLHIIYSNMLTMKNDIYYMRPFSIMVRFPGRFFETHVAKMSNINQIILVISCLVYMGGLSGVSRNDLEQRITYYLEKTSLTEHQNKKMRQLSGGMKRRVGLIQALLNNPDFLIIDEPTTGLDPEERIRIRNLLVDFSKDRTVLFSTHVVEDLAATCTQLAIMKKGNFLYSGSVSGLLENAKGCVWNCTVQNAEEARLLEANYSISSKQYVENGIHMKILSKGKPNEKCVLDNDITLEDAYIYLTNS